MTDFDVEHHGFLRVADGGIFEQAMGQHQFSEGGGGLRQRHGINPGIRAHLAHHIAVKRVARFVGQREHIAERLIVSHENARFFAEHGTGAECPRPLARARFPIDPIPIDLDLKKMTERRVGAGERVFDQILCLVPRKRLAIRYIDRRAEIVPSHAVGTHRFGFQTKDPAGNLEMGEQGLKQGV